MLNLFLSIFLIIIAYLCGSICSAVLVSRLFDLPDPCTNGSENPGATNVLRLAGKKYAAIVLLADILKGVLPVLLAKIIITNPAVIGFTGLAAVVGHMYPLFFKFKGGKGVATALGALLGLQFILGVSVIAIWLLVANFTRYSSLASLISLIAAPFLGIVITQSPNLFPPIMLITCLVIYKHRSNIKRLINGSEPKFRLKKRELAGVAEELLKDKPAEENQSLSSTPKAKTDANTRTKKSQQEKANEP